MENNSPQPVNNVPKLPRRLNLPAKKLLILLAGLVLVGAAGVYGHNRYQDSKKPKSTVEVKKEQLEKDDELSKLKKVYAEASEPAKKYEAAINLGNKYLEKGGKDEAFETFKQAAEIHKDDPKLAVNAYVAMANIADVNGDKATAIENYKKVIEVLKDQTDAPIVAMRNSIQTRVDQLSK